MKRISIIVLTMVFCWPVFAQNLLLNGDFDADISNWSNPFVTSTWISDDGASISGNGSMEVMWSLNNNASFPMTSNEFMVKADYWYWLAASYKVPSASPVPWTWMTIFWYDDMGVRIPNSERITVPFGVPNDVWEDYSGYLQAPENAVTGELSVYFQSGDVSDTDPPFGLWDDLYVIEETIFISDFD